MGSADRGAGLGLTSQVCVETRAQDQHRGRSWPESEAEARRETVTPSLPRDRGQSIPSQMCNRSPWGWASHHAEDLLSNTGTVITKEMISQDKLPV